MSTATRVIGYTAALVAVAGGVFLVGYRYAANRRRSFPPHEVL